MYIYIPNKLKFKRKRINFSPDKLIEFESEVARDYNAGLIRGPIHLSFGNEKQLIKIFKYIDKDDWVLSSWRNHYHALLLRILIPQCRFLIQIKQFYNKKYQ